MGSLVASLSVSVLLASCGPQLGKTAEDSKVATEEKTTVTDSGAEAGVEGAGAVTVPPGAIAVGTTLAVEEVAAPEAFGVGSSVQAASPAVQVSAVGSDGSELTQAASPMTIALDLSGGSTLALLPEATTANLCVLLQAKDSSLIVWRRAALTLDEAAGKASVQSPHFGIYQLVYCGADPLPGFKDAALVGLSSEPKLGVTLTLPAGFRTATGHGKYCSAVINMGAPGTETPSVEVIAITEAAASEAAVSLTFDLVGSLVDEAAVYGVGVGLVAASDACPFAVGDDIAAGDGVDAFVESYVLKLAGAKLKSEGFNATLGEGAYALTDAKVAVGAADDVQIGSPQAAARLCFESEAAGGWVQIRTAIDADGGIGGGDSLTMPVLGAVDKRAMLRASFGTSCVHGDVDAADPATGEPYTVKWPQQALGETFYLSPVTMKIDNAAPTIYSGTACVHIAKPGTDVDLGQRLIELTVPEYGIYLPFIPEAAYDMSVTLTTAAACSAVNTVVPAVPLKGKPLTPEIHVELKAP